MSTSDRLTHEPTCSASQSEQLSARCNRAEFHLLVGAAGFESYTGVQRRGFGQLSHWQEGRAGRRQARTAVGQWQQLDLLVV